MVDLRRRNLLRGAPREAPPLRMPWSIEEGAFTAGCTRCDACVAACPERIVVAGSGGFPELDFGRGECTFCAACVDACPAPVFRSPQTRPWNLRAEIDERCLNRSDVVCQSCAEQCEPEAIVFLREPGRVPQAAVLADRCTGCGACVAGCPVQAVSVKRQPADTAPFSHISSLIIHARPARLAAVCTALEAIAGVELHASSPEGKLIVTLEASGSQGLMEQINQINDIPGVINASLVFHQAGEPAVVRE